MAVNTIFSFLKTLFKNKKNLQVEFKIKFFDYLRSIDYKKSLKDFIKNNVIKLYKDHYKN
jgi:hypothetical protein